MTAFTKKTIQIPAYQGTIAKEFYLLLYSITL